MASVEVPVLGLAHPVLHRGRNLSVRRGSRWLGVPLVRVPLAGGGLSGPLPLATRLMAFDRLTDADLADEHDPACRTPTGLLAVLQQHYPGFAEHETVTLCTFHWPG